MTLRLRLMIGLVVLTAFGLMVTAAASVLALRAYLFDRVDGQLRGAASLGTAPLVAVLSGPTAVGRAGLERAIAPTDYLVEIRRPNGEVVRVAGTGNTHVPAEPLIERIIDLEARVASDAPFTVIAEGERYRAMVQEMRGGRGGQTLVALPLRPVGETIGRLLVIEAAAALAVLAATAALASLLLTRGLRPLHEVARTASAIAAGDLSRRVPEGPPRSETGRLGIALNVMLGQIQAAFAARVASQDQLRRFVADASHELRTPLTSIRGYADLLRGGMVTAGDADDALRRLQEESARMGSLVDDLLYLAHLDEHRPLEQADVDLAALVRDAISDLRAAAPDRPVSADIPPQCVVLGDADALRQLVGNLLANARAHTPPGTPVEVRLRLRNPAGVVLEVADRGPGMPAEVAGHVFDRFYRAPGSRARGRGGSGLGLSIVAATAAAHGGRAEVSSEPGVGTTFRVTLPAPGTGPSG